MTPHQIITQILALTGLSCNVISVQVNRRRWIVFFQVAENLLYSLQYVFLSAWSAFTVSIISAVECIIVYYYANRDPDSPNSKMPLWLMLLIMAVISVVGLIQYRGPFDAIPVVVTAFYTWAIWQPNLRTFRLSAMTFPVCWFIYNWHVGAWVSVGTSVIEFISATSAVIRFDVLKYNHNHDRKECG